MNSNVSSQRLAPWRAAGLLAALFAISPALLSTGHAATAPARAVVEVDQDGQTPTTVLSPFEVQENNKG